MAVPKREQLSNEAVTTLNGAINNSVTTITVTTGSVFPSGGNFRIRINDEIMIATARSTNDLTVIRGQEGTSAASHANTDTVTHVLTAGGLTRWAQDNDPLWGYASSPPLGKIVNDAGTAPLVVSDFTWVNQGGATATDQDGTILLHAPTAASENVRALTLSAPSAPYVYIAALQGIGIREGIPNFGIGFRQSSSGKFVVVHVLCDGTSSKRLAVYRMTSATAFSSTPLAVKSLMHVGKYVWLKIEDDNTNIKFYLSFDGIEWIQLYSESRTAFLLTTGPNQISFELNNQGSTNYEAAARLCHWSRVS